MRNTWLAEPPSVPKPLIWFSYLFLDFLHFLNIISYCSHEEYLVSLLPPSVPKPLTVFSYLFLDFLHFLKIICFYHI